MRYPTTPTTEAQKILVAAGHDLKTEISGTSGRPGDVYESRVVEEVSAGNYTVLVYEYGSIDTNHWLILVNVADRVCSIVESQLVSTPSCHWGGIEIKSVEEQLDGVLVKWTVGEEPHEGKYTLKAKVETKEEIRPVLTKVR